MDVFGHLLSVLMFIENTSARITNEQAMKDENCRVWGPIESSRTCCKNGPFWPLLVSTEVDQKYISDYYQCFGPWELVSLLQLHFLFGMARVGFTMNYANGKGVDRESYRLISPPPPPLIYPHMQHYIYFVRLLRTVIVWVLCGDLKAFLRRT